MGSLYDLVKVKRDILINCERLLCTASITNDFKTRCFLSMTVIEECSKIAFIEEYELSILNRRKQNLSLEDLKKNFRNHNIKKIKSGMYALEINNRSNRIMSLSKLECDYYLEITTREGAEKTWMTLRNSCLYIDLDSQEETVTNIKANYMFILAIEIYLDCIRDSSINGVIEKVEEQHRIDAGEYFVHQLNIFGQLYKKIEY